MKAKSNNFEIRNYLKSHPFSKIGTLALPMLIFVVLMEIYFPKTAPNGFQSFIVAFEFTKSPEQLRELFTGISTDDIRNICTGNYIDFAFMATYTLFLILFFRKAATTFNKKWLLTGIPIAFIILIADFMENIYLFKITDAYKIGLPDAELQPLLNKLQIFTWIKWGGLAIIFAVFSIRSMGRKIISHIEGVAFVIPLLLLFWAVSYDPMGISSLTLSITLAFFLLLFYCFWYKSKKIKKLKKQFSS